MFNRKFHIWLEKYFYQPEFFELIISALLLPFSAIYYCIVWIKFKLAKPIKFDIPVISVGNLVLGGSGKTPLTKALFNEFSHKYKTFIILRGYKRESKDMQIVALNGDIKCDIATSGDEAMEYATNLQNANVIVSNDRKIAINEAIKLGAKLVILDDGFGKADIYKLNILLKPAINPRLNFTIPSGVYRYPKSFYNLADIILSSSDINRQTTIINPCHKMVLMTAIANPSRLEFIFNKCVGREFFADHHKFSKFECENILKKYNADSLLVTQKDYVKIKDFGLSVSILDLKTTILPNLANKIEIFIKNYKNSDTIHQKFKKEKYAKKQ
ncbi:MULTISPECIES: tetraacyldisaccharide 4'-kinase [Campylobacter]|uniref:Tetraacyldisaccharide 4'-kinase n=2 Tax=Campylobacter vicugnae TaxID=1660076 RepID=A0ABZ2EAI2_9BACT|nr:MULTISPECIES: tetraacyldisaccharide 4'-kinase [unclassified Campylobacter]ARR03870.1 tetraacyldisaccharide 4'-kinase [Campylobacter sp. RM12175]MCR8689842.1 tetraacyldisaccharide 4'-kinase [Campylobacter sp. RM9264]MCR8700560.1 tetraacyldisaccharide 4'-kinase [Campylobacter sp. RM12176]